MARSFNGTTDKILTSNNYAINSSQNLSFACWVNVTGRAATFRCLFRASSGGGDTAAYVRSNDTYEVRCGGGFNTPPSPFTPTLNQWCHLGFSCTSGGTLTTYANGVNLGTNSGVFTAAETNPVMIGNDGSAQPLQGYMADFSLWNVVLSDGEFLALSRGMRPFNFRTPNLFYPFDGLQSPEPEFSGNANNGTLTGTAFAPGPPTTLFTPRWPIFTDVPPAQLQLMGQIWM